MGRVLKAISAITVFLLGYSLIINICVHKAKQYALVKSAQDIPIYMEEIIIAPEDFPQKKTNQKGEDK